MNYNTCKPKYNSPNPYSLQIYKRQENINTQHKLGKSVEYRNLLQVEHNTMEIVQTTLTL